MNIKISDATRNLDGNYLLTVEYFKTMLQRDQVVIPARPADSKLSESEYLADAIKKLQSHCEKESTAELDCRKELAAVVKDYK